MIAAFRREGLGRILDFVPNHMGVGGADNPLWLDVLEWGPDSRYAGWFDIDWGAPALTASCWCRFSASNTARCWSAGKLALKFDARAGASPCGPTTRTSCRSAR